MKSASTPRTELRVVVGGRSDQEVTDEQIIDAVERGDHKVSAQLYDRLIRTVDGTIYRLMGRREPEHDDLVQATFEQIVLTIARKRYARACNLRSWAATIASHVALNALRSRRRERKVVDCDAADGDPMAPQDTEREVGARRQFDALREQLAAMDPKKAITVLLHDGLGHELAEVAVLTDASVSAAQTRLVRGRKELAERMRSRTYPTDAGTGREES